MKNDEQETWNATKELIGKKQWNFGSHWSFNFRNDPKRLGFVLSRYKFAAKMCAPNHNIIELGCSEGIGAPILAEYTATYTGVDLDESAVRTAKANLSSEKFLWIYDDFMGKQFGYFDVAISLDVIEHILPDFEKQYFETILMNLSPKGICILGTPNSSAAPYASVASQVGHVNLYSQERLVAVMRKYFHQVLPFGMNDEILHTGYGPMCHYLLCVGCIRK